MYNPVTTTPCGALQKVVTAGRRVVVSKPRRPDGRAPYLPPGFQRPRGRCRPNPSFSTAGEGTGAPEQD